MRVLTKERAQCMARYAISIHYLDEEHIPKLTEAFLLCYEQGRSDAYSTIAEIVSHANRRACDS